jgi:hypothetical protein
VSWLSLTAAALAMCWNLASLVVLIVGGSGARIVAGIGFSVLSVLPAVLLQLCLVERFPNVVRAGYALSTFAVVAHIVELVQDAPNYHEGVKHFV